MNDRQCHATISRMMAYRVFAVILALCFGSPAWAIAPARWQACDDAQTVHCRIVTPEYERLTAPLTTLSTTVRVPPGAIGDPIAVEIDAMASALVRWNGVVIGANGFPGADRASETPGRYSARLVVPRALVRDGDNRVTIVLSAHHLWLPIGQPIHRIATGPPRDAQGYTLRHYLPTLATLALPAVALLVLGALLLAGRIGRQAAPAMAVLAAIVAQGFVEISKIAISYTYPWHLARMEVLTGLTVIVGLLLVGMTSRLLVPLKPRIVVGITGMAMGVACLIIGGPDRQSLAVFEIAMLAIAALTMQAALRHDRRAIALALIAAALAVWAYVAGPDFLDTGYYVSAAIAAIVLVIGAILRPATVAEVPVAIPAVEPVVTLRDGARHHLVAPSQIVFLKADDDYCSLHMRDGREIVVTMTLKAVLALLPSDFVRIHRSHAINVRHLHGTKAGPNGRVAELSGAIVLPIGRAYASALRAFTSLGPASAA
ncbi:LytR/AlgR family response regulator transcription factor [Sphingomonas pokkalii]|nr:LytTR family DNA-binding domain-containing protein [Sphingomonas pokkalii]